MKTRFAPSMFTSAHVPPPPRPPLANMSAPTWPRRLLFAAWPISIPISNEERHDEICENNNAKTSRHCAHHYSTSALADVRHGGGLHAPRDRRAKTLGNEQRTEQGFLRRGIGHGKAHRRPGRALRQHLCSDRTTSGRIAGAAPGSSFEHRSLLRGCAGQQHLFDCLP